MDKLDKQDELKDEFNKLDELKNNVMGIYHFNSYFVETSFYSDTGI